MEKGYTATVPTVMEKKKTTVLTNKEMLCCFFMLQDKNIKRVYIKRCLAVGRGSKKHDP